MDSFFFVEMEGLVGLEEFPAEIKEKLERKAAGWMAGSPVITLCSENAVTKKGGQLVLFTPNKLYFLDFSLTGGSVIVEKVKCFDKKSVMGHAFILAQKGENPQVRVMMHTSMKLKFGIGGSAEHAYALLRRIATCAFFN